MAKEIIRGNKKYTVGKVFIGDGELHEWEIDEIEAQEAAEAEEERERLEREQADKEVHARVPKGGKSIPIEFLK